MKMEDSNSFPTLKTERLILRKPKANDAEVIFELRTDEVVNEFIQRPPERKDNNGSEFIERITKGISNGEILYWIISKKNDPQLMGTICLWNFNETRTIAEVGYDLFTKHHGKGIMNEALDAVLSHGFHSLKLNAIEAFTHKDNSRSTHLLIKNGFVLDRKRKDLDNLNNIIFIKITAND